MRRSAIGAALILGGVTLEVFLGYNAGVIPAFIGGGVWGMVLLDLVDP